MILNNQNKNKLLPKRRIAIYIKVSGVKHMTYVQITKLELLYQLSTGVEFEVIELSPRLILKVK